MCFPSLLQFFGISGILFCVCLSSPPVHTGPAGGVTRLCRAAAPMPLCCSGNSTHCLAAGEAWPGGRRNWSTMDLLCLSKDASMRERMAGTSSYHAVQGLASYMSRERIVPGSAQELGSWQRQEESHLYFSVASKESTTSQWLFYCIIGHLQKGAAFWLSLCVHSRTWATSWENHHRTWRALYIDYSSKLKWSRAWSPSLALQHLHCLTADMFIGTGLIWPTVPGNARVCFDAEECSALMKSLLFWGNTASLYDCKLCHLLWGLQKEPWPALFAGRDIEATTGRFMCKISEILLQVFLIIAMLLN